MTAQIKGFITRAGAGLRAPKSFSSNITPAQGGVAVHYGGPRQPAADPNSDHGRCITTWRAWQTYHMNTHGWTDIAYTGGFCNHGYAFAGRGAKVRTAANGTNAGNQNYYAITWIGGEGQTPTKAALDAADWWTSKLRKEGAGNSVKPHRFFKSTECPGNILVGYARTGDGKTITDTPQPSPTPVSTPKPPVPSVDPEKTKRIQVLLKLSPDSIWGPQTDHRAALMTNASKSRVGWPTNTPVAHHIQGVQMIIGVKSDGVFGPLSQAALHRWVIALQKVLGISADGLWGPGTNKTFTDFRMKNRIN